MHCRYISLEDTPAGNHGSCIHQNKRPVHDEYNYHDSLQQCPIEGMLAIAVSVNLGGQTTLIYVLSSQIIRLII